MIQEHIRVAIVFKNFASWTGISHIGLNVAALTNARVLNQHGIPTTVFPVKNNVDLVRYIEEYNEKHERPLTHVIISAPWLSSWDMKCLIDGFPKIQFAIESHSNVGFLQADPQAVRKLRDVQALGKTHSNIRVAGNSSRFVDWMRLVYDQPVVLLPNLYPMIPFDFKTWDGNGIKIGTFGAVRPQKNFMTAAAAALAMSKILGVPTELHMNTGGEGDGGSVARAITEMCQDVPNFTLIRHMWQPWEKFIELIASMNIMIQPSYTESFNMVTADGIVVGVPSVVSSAITWAPDSWKADSDDALDIARTGCLMLQNSGTIYSGLKSLKHQNRYALEHWEKYLFER